MELSQTPAVIPACIIGCMVVQCAECQRLGIRKEMAGLTAIRPLLHCAQSPWAGSRPQYDL